LEEIQKTCNKQWVTIQLTPCLNQKCDKNVPGWLGLWWVSSRKAKMSSKSSRCWDSSSMRISSWIYNVIQSQTFHLESYGILKVYLFNEKSKNMKERYQTDEWPLCNPRHITGK